MYDQLTRRSICCIPKRFSLPPLYRRKKLRLREHKVSPHGHHSREYERQVSMLLVGV